MKLKEAHIENYKTVEDSTPFSIDQVTCLVGKNEAGKTALLEALYKIKPVEKDKANFSELDYPRRRVSEYRDTADKSKQANVLTTTWELEEKDRGRIEQAIGVNPLSSDSIVLTKGYGNAVEWKSEFQHLGVIAFYLEGSNLNEKEKSELHEIGTVSELIQNLTKTPEPSEAQTQLLAELKKVFPQGSLTSKINSLLGELLPTFIYFDEYYKMPGRVALDDILTRKNTANGTQLTREDNVFLALLDLARSGVEDVQKIGTSEKLIMELEAVSNRITDEIFNYWSQNAYLSVQFRCDQARAQDPAPYNQGFVFSTRIENQRHRVTVNFNERSTGFIWFFSFLVWFSQVRKNYGENLFILLDEPGLTLHGKAQADLLRYINEQLRPTYQVIYTTHSPFMVDPEALLSARTVEDRTSKDSRGRDVVEGTKVGSKVLSLDPDTLLPLQGALGYDISQTLFVGPNTLLVEGPSDILYLKVVSAELAKLKRTSLSPRWTICPSGGLDKVMSFVILFSGRIGNIAVLTDMGDGDKSKVRRLREHELLKAGRVLSADDYTGQTEADIEDFFGRAAYIELIRRCYDLAKTELPPAQKPADASIRCVKEIEGVMCLLANKPEFDHFLPAQYFFEHIKDLAGKLPGWDAALDRFEALFKDLNTLLPEK